MAKRKSRRSRRGGLGAITLRNRRMKTWKAGKKTFSKKATVNVFVNRNRSDEGPGYVAWACPAKSQRAGAGMKTMQYVIYGGGRGAKCGPEVDGRTPTAAYKKALVALGKSKKLK